MATLSRRHVLGLAGLGAASLALSACAGTGSSANRPKQKGNGTLQFWSNHPAESKKTEQKIVEAWNAAHPDTPAQLVDGGKNYEELSQKFNAALAGGDLPDVIVASDVTWFNFAFSKATTPLDDLWAENGIDPKSYVSTFVEDYTYEGKHYGVPYSRSTALLYFDRSVLEKAGLPLDRGPSTWQEFDEWAPRIMDAGGGKPALTIPDGTAYLDWYFEGIAWAFGGRYSEEWDLKFTDPRAIDAGRFLQDQVRKGHIEITKDAINNFGIGTASGLLESTGSLGGLKEIAGFPITTTPLPGPAPGCPTGGAGLSIPDGISDERKRTAIQFVDFLTNTQNTITFTQATGYIPVRIAAHEDPEEVAFLNQNPNARTAFGQLQGNTKPQDYARVFVNGAGRRIGGALDKITTGDADVEKTFGSLQARIGDAINRDIKPYL